MAKSSTETTFTIRAINKTQKAFASVRNGLNKVANTATVTLGAATTALVSMTKAGMESVIGLQQQAKIAGTSLTKFQEYSFAANRLGINQEKLADILKDVNDRVGDFLQTGGGPMADFFENIAPKVGVTADMFRSLSSEQALGLYVKSLKKANLSQAEMTFYMEAMASDSTALVSLFDPLNGSLQDSIKFFDDLGLSISEIDSQKITVANQKVEKLKQLGKGASQQFALQLSPAISGVTDSLIATTKEAGGMGKIVSKVVNAAVIGFGYVGNAIQGWNIIIKGARAGLITLMEKLAIVSNKILKVISNMMGKAISGLNKLIVTANKLPKIDIDIISKQFLIDAKKGGALLEESIAGAKAELYKDFDDEISKKLFSEKLKEKIKDWNNKYSKIDAAQEETGKGIIEVGKTAEIANNKIVASQEKTISGIIEVGEANKFVSDKIAKDTEKVFKSVDKNFNEPFSEFFDLLKRGETSWQSYAEVALRAIGDIITQQQGMGGIGAPGGGFSTGGIGGIVSSLAGVFTSFSGGGNTGNAPRSGGLDGKGGFLAIMHPQETVTDRSIGQQSGGVTIIQNITFSQPTATDMQAQIRNAAPAIAEAAARKVQDKQARGRMQ